MFNLFNVNQEPSRTVPIGDKANYAQTYADERQNNKPKHVKANEQIKTFINEKIKQDWSPEGQA